MHNGLPEPFWQAVQLGRAESQTLADAFRGLRLSALLSSLLSNLLVRAPDGTSRSSQVMSSIESTPRAKQR
jgi:hypothetical protein